VQAQLGERQRIERDLHDGAQQRLLAMALDLQAALVSSGSGTSRHAFTTKMPFGALPVFSNRPATHFSS